MITRVMVKARFSDILGGKVEGDLLFGLKKVFFDVTYPTPPLGWL